MSDAPLEVGQVNTGLSCSSDACGSQALAVNKRLRVSVSDSTAFPALLNAPLGAVWLTTCQLGSVWW